MLFNVQAYLLKWLIQTFYHISFQLSLIPNLLRLGQQHTNIDGFKHEYFEIFYIAMDGICKEQLGRDYNSQTKTAWRKIFRLIVTKVKQMITHA